MGSKSSGNRSHKPRAPGAGRPPKTVRLKDGQKIGFWEKGIASERLATIKIVKRGTFQIVRADGQIINVYTN